MIIMTMSIKDIASGGAGGYLMELTQIDSNGRRTPYLLPGSSTQTCAIVNAPRDVMGNVNFAYTYAMEHWGVVISQTPTSILLEPVPCQTEFERLNCVWWAPCVRSGEWDYKTYTNDAGELKICFD